MDAPEGLTFEQSPGGTMLVDQRPKRHLAIIQSGFSGSGSGSGSGQNVSGQEVADNMENAYFAKFAQWINNNDTFEVIVQPDQPNVLAIEANGVEDVPDGAIVELLPGPGQPDFYFFFWAGEVASGSGGGMTVTCTDGTTYNVAINGNQIVVS
jgi:hypothetical protein